MYATAHRVVSALEEEGVNAFLHFHGRAYAWPDDPRTLPESDPGTLVERRTEVPPGGNRVRAYLDVLAPDGTPRAEIAEALAALDAELPQAQNPVWCTHGRVTVRFGAAREVEQRGLDALRAELSSLGGALGALLERRSS